MIQEEQIILMIFLRIELFFGVIEEATNYICVFLIQFNFVSYKIANQNANITAILLYPAYFS